MHTQQYKDYMASQHWHDLRHAAYKAAGHKCEACQRQVKLDGHHLRYRDDLTKCTTADIMALCRRCHDGLHSHLKQQGANRCVMERQQVREIMRRLHGRFWERPEQPKLPRKKKPKHRHRRKGGLIYMDYPKRTPTPPPVMNAAIHAAKMATFEEMKARLGSVGGIPMPDPKYT
jgi:hypothetical protein